MATGPERRRRFELKKDGSTSLQMVGQLDDDHWRVRAAAALDLGALGDGAAIAVQRIARRLEDPNGHVRKAAASALGDLCLPHVWGRTPGAMARETVPALVSCLADVDPGLRRVARQPLQALAMSRSIGDLTMASAPAIADLKSRLRDEDWRIREAAAKALADLSAATAPIMPVLLEAVADDSQCVRRAAKAAVEEICANKDIEDIKAFCAPAAFHLLQRLSNDSWRIRCAAAWTLGVAGGAVVVGARRLMEALSDRDVQVQVLAIEALGSLGPGVAPALTEIVRKMRDEQAVVRDAARSVHAQYCDLRRGNNASQSFELARVLKRAVDEDPWVRKNAARELASLGLAAAPAVPEVLGIVADEDSDTSGAASATLDKFHELGLLGDFEERGPEGSPVVDVCGALSEMLDDEDMVVALHGAVALANLACAAAPMLLRLVARSESDADPMKPAAKKLLEILRKEKAMVDLGAVLDEILPVLVEGVAEALHEADGEADGKGETRSLGGAALEALQKLHAAGLVLDDDGHLERALQEYDDVLAEDDDDFDESQSEVQE